jgi:hypothetical protein
MAVYGVGAYYDSDVSKDFIDKECFCIGYGKSEATTLYEMLRRAKLGDIVYIKSFTPRAKNTLYIKAIGFVVGKTIKSFEFEDGSDMGFGRSVKWVADFTDSVRKVKLRNEDRVNNVYPNTMYEEYSDSIINKLLEWIVE